MSNLNPKQMEAVTAHQGPVLVLAGAGSGKTTVLIERVAYLIRECKLAPWSILAITFTKKAAEELKTRLERQLGAAALNVWAFTFHAACARILRRDIEKLGGYDSRFTVYDSDDSARVMKSCIKELNLDDKQYPYRAMLAAVSRAKNAMIVPEEYAKAFSGAHNAFRIQKEEELYALYHKKLRAGNALDFDDLLLLTVVLFERCPDVLEHYQDRFKALLVDEYQDTNALQYRFCSLLAKKHKNLFVVGDDDQSIYRFRGATIENILHFERQYPGCHTIRLEQNYRSTQNILNAANGVIENNLGRKGKTLWTEAGTGAPIRVFHARDGGEEGYYIAGLVSQHARGGGKFKDFAVLYRMNAQAFQIEESLRRAGIPYRIIGGTRFIDRAEIRDALAFLHVLHNPSDDLRLTRIINVPARGIGDKTVDTASALAAEYGVSLWNILENAALYPELSRAARNLTAFWRMMDELRGLTCPLSELYDRMLDATGYLRFYQTQKDVESEGRAENVLELRSAIVKYEEESGDPTLAGFLEDMALAADVENYDPNADAVVLMTIHSAKGLEFPVVFVVGVEEGIFPGIRAVTEPEELEEERRLCYVAITRARQALHVTCADSRLLYGHTTYNRHSRFIDELPERCVEHERTRATGAPPSRGERTPRRRPAMTPVPSIAPSAAVYTAGDRVEHKAFGTGLVSQVTPMGGDALMEIIFDGVGAKRLMLKSAAAYIKKL